jgi:hypothetical protein
MTKFLVLFKDLKKQFNIDSQDDATAKAWGEKQLSFWQKESRISITPVIAATVPAADPPAAPAAANTAPVKTKKGKK